jgi:hypothetical protein
MVYFNNQGFFSNYLDLEHEFLQEGFVKLGPVLDVDQCKKLKDQFNKLRPIDAQFFKENVFYKENEFDSDKSHYGTGPGTGRNLTERVNLDFIEKNPVVQETLSKVLGSDYKIMQKIFVMGLPENMIPDWINERSKNLGFVNLCALVKPEFRDMTYFHGVDYHQDLIDHKNRIGDFITLYIYLEDVTANMSPLHVIPKSHIFGATTAPHDLKSVPGNKIQYSDRKGKSAEFNFKMLTGTPGSVFFWSEYNLHGTMPTITTTVPRVSLRYLIERGKATDECIIDKFLKNIDAPLSTESTREKSVEYGNAEGSNLLKLKEQIP